MNLGVSEIIFYVHISIHIYSHILFYILVDDRDRIAGKRLELDTH